MKRQINKLKEICESLERKDKLLFQIYDLLDELRISSNDQHIKKQLTYITDLLEGI